MATGKDLIIKAVTGVHEAIFRASKGRLLNRGSGMPVLMLTTTGRKSGRPRTTMLTSPLRDGDAIMLVASKGGDDRNPAWFLNLEAQPDAALQVARRGREREGRAVAPHRRRPRQLRRLPAQDDAGHPGRRARALMSSEDATSDTSEDLKARLRADLTDAIRSQDEVTVATLRLALAAITKAEVAGETSVTLSDEQIVELLRGEGKRRAEAAELYERGDRAELAARERAQAAVLERYLPAEIDDAALGAVVAEEVATARAEGATGGKAMGQVIKAVRARGGTDASGGRVAAAVKAAVGTG